MATRGFVQEKSLKVYLATRDAQVAQLLQQALEAEGRLVECAVFGELELLVAKAIAAPPNVILLDDAILEERSLAQAVPQLTEMAPVVAIAMPVHLALFDRLVALGEVEFVPRAGDYVWLAARLLERRLRWAGGAGPPLRVQWPDTSPDLGEILRHEVNNPLTGILGNAELLLAQRENLPASAARRLETIVDLAVRLRETIRRLSAACQNQDIALSA